LSLHVYFEFLRLGGRLEVEASGVQAVAYKGRMRRQTAVDLRRSEAALTVLRGNLLLQRFLGKGI